MSKKKEMRNACYDCQYCGSVPGSAHNSCSNSKAKVDGDLQGIKGGWFVWPINFDPVWLLSCDGFKKKKGGT